MAREPRVVGKKALVAARARARNDVIFHSRYSVAPTPDAKTCCGGECGGLGVYPENDRTKKAWQEIHAARCTIRGRLSDLINFREAWYWRYCLSSWFRAFLDWPGGLGCDGWHFVRCERCGGSGKESKS